MKGIIRFVMIVLLSLSGCVDKREVENPTPLEGTMDVEYPIDLWDQDIEGSSLLRLRITFEGIVDSVSVLESSGYIAFDSSAVSAAREMRFSPALRDGETISVWAQIPITFSKTDR